MRDSPVAIAKIAVFTLMRRFGGVGVTTLGSS